MITCKEVVELVTEYLSETLSAADRERVEAHLADCDPCTAYLAQMRAMLTMAGRLDEQSLPDDVKRDLLAAFARWRK